MKYLVTGGLGFIGSHLCDALVQAGHTLVVLDDCSTGKREQLTRGATLIEGDVSKAAAVASALHDVDGCFHLAAIASVERAERERGRAHAVNMTGTVNVFEAAGATIPVVYASSAAVYGDNPTLPLSENMAVIPLNAYGDDKRSGEMHAHSAAKTRGLKSAGLRFFNVYGSRQDPSSPYSGVISIFARHLAEGKGLTIFGDGHQTRDFIYVGDVVRALMLSMKVLEGGTVTSEVFNICTGIATDLIELAYTLAAVLNKEATIAHAKARVGDIRYSLGNPEKAKRLLGFTAETKLEAGLRAMLGIRA